MYVAGGHTKTSVNIWSMESAIESGKIVANLIFEKIKNLKLIYIITMKKVSLLFHYKIDDLLIFFLNYQV